MSAWNSPGGRKPTGARSADAGTTECSSYKVPDTDLRPFTWAALDDEDELPPVRVHRQQLPLHFEDLSRSLLATVGALTRLSRDDRFPKHRHAVVQRNLAVLNRAAAGLRDLWDDLRGDETRWSP